MAPDLNDIYTGLTRAKHLVIDVETDGLDWKRNKSVGYVLTFSGHPDDSVYLPIGHATGNLDRDKVLAMIRMGIQCNPNLRTVGFNLGFDLGFMANDEITPLGPLECSQVNAVLIDERQTDLSLDGCCLFMNTTPKKGEALYAHMADKFGGAPTRKAQMQNFHLLDGGDPLAVDYAQGDGTSTWHLWDKQQHALDAQDLRQIWAIECRVIRVLARMTRRGVRVDEDRLEQVRRLVVARLDDARRSLPEGFNDRGPSHLQKLFRDAGYTDWPMTEPSKRFPNGQPSFTETWLQTNELGKKVIRVRKLRNVHDSFLIPLRDNHLWRGRVHATFNQVRGEEYGTITGRLSCSQPNLQQVPKRNKELGPIFRSIFVPDPGYIWESRDYMQIEPRLLAYYGNVQLLKSGYLSDPPVDAHSRVAQAAGIDREPGKRLNQALLTGAGVTRMTELLMEYGADPSQVREIMANYFKVMPEIKPFQKHAANVMKGKGFIRSLLGRRARLENNDYGKAYKAVNRILQLSNADVNKKALADVDEWYVQNGDQGAQLLNDVHDDLCHQYRPEAKPIFNEAVRLMEDYGPGRSVELDLPLPTEGEPGKNWAESTYGIETVRKAFKSMGGSYA